MATTVYDICSAKINKSGILKHALFSKNQVLCVDGTSATKKTSILARTNYEITKIQKIGNFKNVNRYFPAMLGYICSGLVMSRYGDTRLNDRGPLNPLEWHVLWCCMSDYFTTHGNTAPTKDALTKYEIQFKQLKNSFFYEFFSKKINCIAFVDSNCARCDSVRSARNEGSDIQRSNWKFYTPMQNLMYSTLYENRVIDMAWFDEFTTDQVCDGIAQWINDLTVEISQLSINKMVPLRRYNLPINFKNTDFALQNMTTHAYRSVGRVGCKMLNRELDKKNAATTLQKHYLPSYVSLDKIQVPLMAIMHQQSFSVNATTTKYHIPEESSAPTRPFMDFTDEDGNF